MGKYDEQVADLHRTLTRAGITCAVNRDGDEHTLTVDVSGPARRLVIDPTDDGCYDLEVWTTSGNPGYPLIESVAESVGDNFMTAIVNGLIANEAATTNDDGQVLYRHDERGSILFVEAGRPVQVLRGHAFPGSIACAVVHELDNAIQIGRRNGYGSHYLAEQGEVLAQHGPHGPLRPLPVDGLTCEQADALAHELHQAGQMGAHT